jgi:hypothetical protein
VRELADGGFGGRRVGQQQPDQPVSAALQLTDRPHPGLGVAGGGDGGELVEMHQDGLAEQAQGLRRCPWLR